MFYVSADSTNYLRYTRDTLAQVDAMVTYSNHGSRWKEIPHSELVTALLSNLYEKFSLEPVPDTESYYVSKNLSKLIGGFQLRAANTTSTKIFGTVPQETAMCIGFRHSNDLKHALTIVAGGHVALCSNGMICGEDKFKHKHTNKFNLDSWIFEKLVGVMTQFSQGAHDMYQFANRIVTPEDHQKLLLTFARTDTLSWSATGELDRHWLNANNPVRIFENGSPWSFEWDFQSSAWDWYNGFTYLAKKYSVNRQYESLHRGFSLIKSELCLPA